MITLIKPILFAFLKSDAVKKLIIDLLDALAKETDNDLDDTAVAALRIIKSGEASTQDLKAACDWLKTNDISGVATDGNALSKLANILPEIDPEMVQRRLYGKSHI